MGKTRIGVNDPEKAVTRIAAALVGAAFILGPSISPLFYPSQRQELITSPWWLLTAAFLMVVVCAAIGVIFLVVGVTGKLPLRLVEWLRRHNR